jgi:hypothetical protein
VNPAGFLWEVPTNIIGTLYQRPGELEQALLYQSPSAL